jgi:hypothetical protein
LFVCLFVTSDIHVILNLLKIRETAVPLLMGKINDIHEVDVKLVLLIRTNYECYYMSSDSMMQHGIVMEIGLAT